jgi:hypothetical protein
VRHVLPVVGVGHLDPLWDDHGENGCFDETARRGVGGGYQPKRAEVFGQDFKGWCAANNVSRSTAYRHKKRIEEPGRREPLSTRPKSRPDHQTPPEVEAEIVQLRQELEGQPGHDCGADNTSDGIAV